MPAHTWHRSNAVRTGDQLTVGERAADRMRDSFGSWVFIGATMAFIAMWIFLVIAVKAAIDNHQLTILNLILSCFAAMQGAIILLAAKRADAVSSEVAVHTEKNTDSLMTLTGQVHELLKSNTELTRQVAGLVTQQASRRAPGDIAAH